MRHFIAKIKQFDAYSKPLEDFRVKTLTGGAVTLVSGAVMVLLFLSELRMFLSTEVIEELFVDSSSGEDRVEIKFEIIFPVLACNFVTVDVMDQSGEHQSDVQHSVWKVQLNDKGEQLDENVQKQELNKATSLSGTSTTPGSQVLCGSCFGAESLGQSCCNTCDEVKEAYRRKGWAIPDLEGIQQCKGDSWIKILDKTKGQGCKVTGSVQVAKVGGNFHIAPGDTLSDRHSHVHDLHSLGPQKFNTSHVISHLSFGHPYPGKEFPLDGHRSIASTGGTMFQYFTKVVPTMYVFADKKEILTHQFAVTQHQKVIQLGSGDGLPGFFMQYEFSPLMVKFTERQQSLTHFLVSVCAIIGGVFTVASLIDSLIYHSSRVLQQKIDLGKAT